MKIPLFARSRDVSFAAIFGKNNHVVFAALQSLQAVISPVIATTANDRNAESLRQRVCHRTANPQSRKAARPTHDTDTTDVVNAADLLVQKS